LQNIDPIFILQPAIVVAICVGLLVYWRRKRGFELEVIWYSFIAYASAIALKYAVQLPTIGAVEGYFGGGSLGLGIYYGLQTVFFEVGLAFVVARYLVRKGRLRRKDAEAYGAGLAFWENAALLGALPLINLIAYYSLLSTNSSLAQTLYNQLVQGSPGLFDPPAEALRSVALGTLERVSSIILHSAWGYLCALGAIYSRKMLFYVALPMGLVDVLVPFADMVSLALFEALVFALALLSMAVAWYAPRRFAPVNSSAAVETDPN
jgi:hypothetical protein